MQKHLQFSEMENYQQAVQISEATSSQLVNQYTSAVHALLRA